MNAGMEMKFNNNIVNHAPTGLEFLPSIATPRLVIQCARDLAQTRAAYQLTSIPDIQKGMEFPQAFTLKAFRHGLRVPPPRQLFLIVERENHANIGIIVLWRVPKTSGWWQILYGIAPESRGRGFAKEAIDGLIKYLGGIPTVRGVLAQVRPENQASIAVLQHLGMMRKNVQKDLYFYLVFEKSFPEFTSRQDRNGCRGNSS
jgi:RimJ/RimL family protein N-acetyltransferase